MAIPYYEDKKYNVKNTEATPKTETPKTQTTEGTSKSPDNFYNDYMDKKSQKEYNYVSTYSSAFDDWAKKNSSFIKYAGDGAKKSIDAGLKEAPDYMADADKGTNFEDVQNASVKRKLANDSGNTELADKASMEMIGHLSDENKEDYLKLSVPLQTYIDAKDEYDYKHNNYTTTEFLDTTPDEGVRQVQQRLNELGYTDKFGEKLKEDGIEGAKTRYAKDKYKADNKSATDYESATQKYRNSAVLTSRSGNARTVIENDMFDYNTRLSYSQTYNSNVKTLQNRLVELGYLDMSNGGWGYYGPKTLNAVNKYKRGKGLGNTGRDAGVVGKDTWESLGLLWRTQEDIDAGVQIVTRGAEQYYDLSNAINKALWTAKSDFEEHRNDVFWEKWAWFADLVGNSGVWNIKKDEETWKKTLNISSNSFNKKFFLFGKIVDREILGNITYGYLGTAAGLSIHELLGGSMVNDVITHGFDNLSNEYNDHSSIKIGINWYKSANT